MRLRVGDCTPAGARDGLTDSRCRSRRGARSPSRRAVRGHRVGPRWCRCDARNKPPVVANTAITGELAGWCWSLAVLDT